MSHLPLADAELQYSRLFQATRRDYSLLGTLGTSNITIALEKNPIPTTYHGGWWEWENGSRKVMGFDVPNVPNVTIRLRSGLK